MVSRVNGQKVSRSLVWRTIRSFQLNRDELSEPPYLDLWIELLADHAYTPVQEAAYSYAGLVEAEDDRSGS